MREILLTGGGVALVDDEDFERISAHRWRMDSRGRYARRSSEERGKGRIEVLMHREVSGFPDGVMTDHINGNRLDNRRSNLRPATNSQNQMNRKTSSASGFKGVVYVPRKRKWQATIRIQGRTRFLGLFASPDVAARAYDSSAAAAFGEYARLNFPGTTP